MFADQAVTLDLGFPAARDRFLQLTHGDRLDGMSQDAYADGLGGRIRVGPLGSVPGMSKLVRVSLLDPDQLGHARHATERADPDVAAQPVGVRILRPVSYTHLTLPTN